MVVSDDHPVVRQGLRSFLEAEGFAWWARPADGDEAVRLVARPGPTCCSPTWSCRGRRDRGHPAGAGRGVPVGILVLTSFSGAEQVIPAIQAGADGYLLKDAGPRR